MYCAKGSPDASCTARPASEIPWSVYRKTVPGGFSLGGMCDSRYPRRSAAAVRSAVIVPMPRSPIPLVCVSSWLIVIGGSFPPGSLKP